MSKQPSLGAFYQCYKRPKAVISALGSFRRHYPDATVYMVCDAGHDYSTLAAHFKCDYEYSRVKAGTGNALHFDNIDTLSCWLNRLRCAADRIDEDYILLLEDDVLVLDSVRDKLRYTINGVNKGMRLGRPITRFLKRRNRSIPFYWWNYYWGGFGGCIVNRRFIVEKFNNVLPDIRLLTPYVDRPLSSDIWLTILTLYYGGTIGPLRSLCETWHADYEYRKKVRNDIAILHQFKETYNVPLTREEVALLGCGPEFSQTA